MRQVHQEINILLEKRNIVIHTSIKVTSDDSDTIIGCIHRMRSRAMSHRNSLPVCTSCDIPNYERKGDDHCEGNVDKALKMNAH